MRGICLKAFCDERENMDAKKTMKSGISLLNERNRGTCLRQGTLERMCCAVAVGLVGLSVSVSAQIVSNLGESDTSFPYEVRGSSFASNAFTTGSNAGGYTLDSVTVAIESIAGSPGDLVVGIHAASGADPAELLEDLAGADPGAAGNHTFTSAGTHLDANTTYHIQLSSPTSSSGNSYIFEYTYSSAQTSSDGWEIANSSRESSNSGGSWSNFSTGRMHRFSIQATPVPEPHEYAMFAGLGLIGFVAARRHLISKALA